MANKTKMANVLKNAYFESGSEEIQYISERLGKMKAADHIHARQFAERVDYKQFIMLTYKYYICPLNIYLFTTIKQTLTAIMFLVLVSIIVNYFRYFNMKMFKVLLFTKWMLFWIVIMPVYQAAVSIGPIRERFRGYFIFKYVFNLHPHVKFGRILRSIKQALGRYYEISISRRKILRIIAFEDDVYRHMLANGGIPTVFYTYFLESTIKALFPMAYGTIAIRDHRNRQTVNYAAILVLAVCSPVICIALFISQAVDAIKIGSSFSDILAYDYLPMSTILLRRRGMLMHVYKNALRHSHKYALRIIKRQKHSILDVVRKLLSVFCSMVIFVCMLMLMKMLIYQRNLLRFELIFYKLELYITDNVRMYLKLIDIVYIIGFFFYLKNSLDLPHRKRRHGMRKSYRKWARALHSRDEQYNGSSRENVRSMMARRICIVLRECLAAFTVPWQVFRMNRNINDFYDTARQSSVFQRFRNGR